MSDVASVRDARSVRCSVAIESFLGIADRRLQSAFAVTGGRVRPEVCSKRADGHRYKFPCNQATTNSEAAPESRGECPLSSRAAVRRESQGLLRSVSELDHR